VNACVDREEMVEADTLEEARAIAKSRLPKGWKVSSEKIVASGTPKSVGGQGTTVEDAFARLEKEIPPGSTIITREQRGQPDRTTVESLAFDEDSATRLAAQKAPGYDRRESVQLSKPGFKGIFGIGRKPHLFHVTLARDARVSITYKEKAKALFTFAQRSLLDALDSGDTEEEIAQMLDSGVPIEVRDDTGQSPLMCAVRRGRPEVVKLLLSKNAEVDARDKDMNTPLMRAAWRGSLEIVKLLIAAKANVNARDAGKYTPLIQTFGRDTHIEIARLLLDSGADVNASTSWGSTVLGDAAKDGNERMVELLLARGASINRSEHDGYTALSRAAMNGHDRVVEILLAHGADVNLKTKHGHTALTLALDRGNSRIVELLKKAG
jgi:ankyrin repeat protein